MNHLEEIGLFKVFSRWILHIFSTPKENGTDWELVSIVHEINEEDLLNACKYKL